jgi:AcrR family transcriptional regulator
MTAPVTPAENPSRLQRRRNRKVAEILTATAQVLTERGYYDTSLDEIAERLDVAKASLYHYFPSKEALVLECIDTQSTEVLQQLRQIAASVSGTARDRLVALVERQLDISVNESPHLATLYRVPLDWPASYHRRIKELRREHYQIFRSVVRDGIASGEFEVADEDVAMHNFFGAINYVPVWCRPRSKKQFRESSRVITDSLLQLFSPADSR